MVEATFRQTQTKYKAVIVNETLKSENGTEWFARDTMVKYLGKAESVNVLGLIFISMTVGIAASMLKKKAGVFLKFFTIGTEIVFIVLRKLFLLAPIGIASLIAVSIAKVTNLATTFSQLGLLVVTVTAAIFVHTSLAISLILLVFTRRNPLTYYSSLLKAFMIAFATTSSGAALPETISVCENRHRIDRRVTRFVLPICSTINSDNSAVYITSAAIFVAQLSGSVTTREIIIIGVLSAVASMSLPPVPSASIVALIIILTSLGMSANQVALLFSLEWLLDGLRSGANVLSDATCAAVTYRFCEASLKPTECEPELTELTTNCEEELP